ncbi:MAG: hypothetical protein JSV52_11665 [Candidatus Zixiibacteriota bacterium]|nr:MAG: hypothetical protein JSV52_11665 [candidate division Zixibacteria bacterium]
MKPRWDSILILLLVSLLVSTNTFGFDGRRKDFALGISLGGGTSFFHQKMGTLREKSTSASYQLRLRAARGLSDQLLVTFASRMSMYDYNDIDTALVEDDLFESFESFLETIMIEYPAKALTNHHTLTIGLTYFFRPEAPSLYIYSGIGFAIFPTFIDNDIVPGLAAVAGGGYEFMRHLTVDVEFLYGHAAENSGPNRISRDYGTVTVSLQWLLY